MKVTREDYFITETRAGSFRPWNSFVMYRLNLVGLIMLFEINLIVSREKDEERRLEYIKFGSSLATNIPIKKLRLKKEHMNPYRVSWWQRMWNLIPVNAEDLLTLWNHIMLFNFPQSHSWEIPKAPGGPKTAEEIRMEFLLSIVGLVGKVAGYFKVDANVIYREKNIWQLYIDFEEARKDKGVDKLEDLNIAVASQGGGAKELSRRYSNEAVGAITINIGKISKTYVRKNKGQNGETPASADKEPDAGEIQ